MKIRNSILAFSRSKVATLGGCVFAVVLACTRLYVLYRYRQNATKRERKRKECQQNIQELADRISKDEDAQALKDTVTKLPAAEIVQKIKDGHLTAVQVLHAFQAKALDAHAVTNCVCWFLPEAEEEARQADANPNKEGPLYGLPISLKDHYCIKGHDSVIGVACLCYAPFQQDCQIVEIIRRNGGIPFVKTNVPQLMLTLGSSNPVFGCTYNPHDTSRSPGGSSSGEGAIVAYGASPLGFASDIGGSIRVPSSFCGIYGFKPTTSRISRKNQVIANYGGVRESYGPMAPSMEALLMGTQCIMDRQMMERDWQIPIMPFNQEIFEDTKPLKIGFYKEVDKVPAVPAVKRAVDIAIQALQKRGHIIVEWLPHKMEETIILATECIMASGGEDRRSKLQYDEIDVSNPIFKNAASPWWWRRLQAAIFSPFVKNAFLKRLMKAQIGLSSVSAWWNKLQELQEHRDECDKAWMEAGLDAVICPVSGVAAPPHTYTGTMPTATLLLALCPYTILYNALDLPAGVVPVTKVTPQDIQDMKDFPKETPICKAIHKGMEGSEGLPVGVQVVAPRFRDETALRVMKELDGALANNS